MEYRVHRLVLNPDGFFEGRSEGLSLWIPALAVFMIGVIRVARSLYVSDYTASAMEASGGASPAGGGMRMLFTVPSVITPFIGWLVIGAILVAVCTYLGGEGNGTDTVAVAGWGYLPALVGTVLALGVTFYILSGQDPSGMQEAVDTQRAVFETLRSTQMRAFGYLLVGWQAFIWTFGIKHVQKLELKRAAVPAIVAATLLVAWDLFGTAVIVKLVGVFY
jgi:hypothetical protein